MTEEAKDTPVIKRPRSAYILFGIAKREDVKTENPTAKATEILKLLGAAWNQLTEAEKGVY
jgi:hypothetical protein